MTLQVITEMRGLPGKRYSGQAGIANGFINQFCGKTFYPTLMLLMGEICHLLKQKDVPE